MIPKSLYPVSFYDLGPLKIANFNPKATNSFETSKCVTNFMFYRINGINKNLRIFIF